MGIFFPYSFISYPNILWCVTQGQMLKSSLYLLLSNRHLHYCSNSYLIIVFHLYPTVLWKSKVAYISFLEGLPSKRWSAPDLLTSSWRLQHGSLRNYTLDPTFQIYKIDGTVHIQGIHNRYIGLHMSYLCNFKAMAQEAKLVFWCVHTTKMDSCACLWLM